MRKWPARPDGAFPDIRQYRNASHVSEDILVAQFLIEHGHSHHTHDHCKSLDGANDALLILDQKSNQKESAHGVPQKSSLIDDRAHIASAQQNGGQSVKNGPKEK